MVQDAQRTPSRISGRPKGGKEKRKEGKKGRRGGGEREGVRRELHLDISFSNYRKSKIKKFPERSQRKNVPAYRKSKIRIVSDFSETMQQEESGVK